MSVEFRPSGGAVLRTPALPLAALRSLTAGMSGDADADMAVVTDRLRALVRDPLVREAIFLASPSLDERLDAWLDGDDPRVTRSVLSYVTRMAARCTPFGVFAGCVAGSTGEGATDIALAGRDTFARHTRLDFEYLARLVADVERDDATRAGLRFVPNTSMYRAGGRLRLAEARYDGTVLRYRRVAVEDDEYLTATLARASRGATLAELAQSLVTDDISLDEATAYVGELVDAQLLVSDLGPEVTGDDPGGALAARLAAHPATKPAGVVLTAAQDAIARLDAVGVGVEPQRFRAIADALGEAGTAVEIARLFQGDLILGASRIHVGDDLLNALRGAVDVLHRLHPPPPDDTELARFKTAFGARYEGAEVALLEALDEEVGIGFGSVGSSADGQPLLPGPVGGGRGRDGQRVRPFELVLMELVDSCRERGETTLRLDNDAITRLANPNPLPLPDAFAVHASLFEEAGGFGVLVHHASGPPGVRMLGRFSAHDPGIAGVVRASLIAEEAAQPEARFFEVVHLPEGRVGNVLCRPVLRGNEVEYLGHSGAPPEHILPATDLLVSLVGNRLRLRSSSLGCEVIGRISTAHNLVSSRIALYRFLGALQGDGRAEAMIWRWGILEVLPFLPRVTAGEGIVLARARWRVTAKELEALRGATTPAARRAALHDLVERRQLPRWAALAQADHELVLDMHSAPAAELLAFEARKAEELTVLEVLDIDGVVDAPEGRHAAELIVPFARSADATPDTLPERPAASVPRAFAPGTQWTSLKLYCGAATADAVLREVVAPFVAELSAHVDRWFFLRYGDPEWHLRVRVHGDTGAHALALDALHRRGAVMLGDGRIGNVVVDTYRREVERYGGPAGIELFEQVSHADSDAVLAIVSLTSGDDGLDRRWRATAVGVDRLLADLRFDVAERQQLVRQWAKALARELGESWRHHAGTVHRREGRALAQLLAGEVTEPALGPLAIRSALLAPVVDELRARAARGELTESVEGIASSYAHMHVNRMLRGAARVQELVIYDLLDRWYRAALARGG